MPPNIQSNLTICTTTQEWSFMDTIQCIRRAICFDSKNQSLAYLQEKRNKVQLKRLLLRTFPRATLGLCCDAIKVSYNILLQKEAAGVQGILTGSLFFSCVAHSCHENTTDSNFSQVTPSILRVCLRVLSYTHRLQYLKFIGVG